MPSWNSRGSTWPASRGQSTRLTRCAWTRRAPRHDWPDAVPPGAWAAGRRRGRPDPAAGLARARERSTLGGPSDERRSARRPRRPPRAWLRGAIPARPTSTTGCFTPPWPSTRSAPKRHRPASRSRSRRSIRPSLWRSTPWPPRPNIEYDSLHRYAFLREADHWWALDEFDRALRCLRERESRSPRANRDRWLRWPARISDQRGRDHPDTLAVRGNIARWTGEAGDGPMAHAAVRGAVAGRGAGAGPRSPRNPHYPRLGRGLDDSQWRPRRRMPTPAREGLARAESRFGAEHQVTQRFLSDPRPSGVASRGPTLRSFQGLVDRPADGDLTQVVDGAVGGGPVVHEDALEPDEAGRSPTKRGGGPARPRRRPRDRRHSPSDPPSAGTTAAAGGGR